MSRAEEFVSLYNQLDSFLRRQLSARGEGVDSFMTFSQVVSRAAAFNSTIRRKKVDLMEMADLRNAIVHRERSNGNEYIAEPTSQIVLELRELVESVLRPSTAFAISSRKPRVFAEDEELTEALALMRERQYSQIVVQVADQIRLLSSLGFTNWLEHQVPDEIIALTDVPLASVLAHEPPGSHAFAARDASADDIRDLFLTPPTPATERLQAVIVTQSGRADQAPLGIITPWDVVS